MSLQPGPGLQVGRWRLQQRLGQGGVGTVWLAIDEDGREAALKLLTSVQEEPLRALSRVCHPVVVGVLEGGSDPAPFLAMEWVQGRLLTAFMASGKAPVPMVVQVGAVLADGLAAVHHAGVLHGDIKPSNIVVEDLATARLCLVDFALEGGSAGGSLQYAAPDRLAGASMTAASDVYSLGLVLYEMLHGQPPWPDLSLSEQLTRRRREAPTATLGPPWLQELLEQMLQREAGHRPTSQEVAEAFETNGAHLPYPGPELVRQRARTIHMSRPAADAALEEWIRQGGVLAMVGEEGSGRSHQLTRAVRALHTRGLPCLRIQGLDRPWGAVARAIRSPVLDASVRRLPVEQDLEHRAQAIAALLEEAAPPYLGVVVEDWDRMDEGSRKTVEALAQRETVAILVSMEKAPSWAQNVVKLGRMEASQIGKLARDLLGEAGDLEALVTALVEVSEGLPNVAMDLMVAAVSSGAVVRRSHRWQVDREKLAALLARGKPVRNHLPKLSDEAKRVAELSAFHGDALSINKLRSLTGYEPGNLRRHLAELRSKGVIRVELGRVQIRRPRTAQHLVMDSEAAQDRHLDLVRFFLDASPVPWEKLGPHLVGARDPELIQAHGERCLVAASLEEPRAAGQLADEIWALAPIPELGTACVKALVQAGRPDDALGLGDRLINLGTATSGTCVALGLAASEQAAKPEVIEHYLETARQLLTENTKAPLELLSLEARAFRERGENVRAIHVARAITERPPPSDPTRLDLWLVGHVTLAQCLETEERIPEAISALAGVPLEIGAGTRGRAILDADQGRLLWRRGRVSEAGEALQRAARSPSGLPMMERARTLNRAASATYLSGERSEALALWEECLLMFERLNSVLEQVRIHVSLCDGYREVCRWERSRQAGMMAFETAGQLGEQVLRAKAAISLAALRMWRNEPDAAEQWIEVANGIVEEHKLVHLEPLLARHRAELAVHAQSPNASAQADRAARIAEEAEEAIELAHSRALGLIARVREDLTVDLEAAIDEAESPIRDMGAAADLAEIRLWFAEACLQAGRTRDALAQVARVVVYADEVGHKALRARADVLTARAGAGMNQGLDDRSDLLLDLAVAVTRERDLPTLLDAIVDAALRLLDGTRSFVVLVEQGEPMVAAARHVSGADPGRPSMTIVRRAIDGRKEVIAANLDERGDLREAQSLMSLELGSVMCVPLIDGETTLGAIVVDSPNASEQELMQATRMLRALAAHAAIAVNNARRLRENLERARWAAEVAHDIRGPVGSMMTIATEIKSENQSASWNQQALTDIVGLGRQVLDLAESLLNKRPLELRELDLVPLCREVVRSMTGAATRQAVHIRVEGEPSAWIRGDGAQLTRVFANLVDNALKYSPAGSEVMVTLSHQEEQVQVDVRDHGAGIPDLELERIFESGVQASGSLTGHGLGLSIARSLVADHGGTIAAHNHPEGGTVLRVRFDLAVPTLTDSG